jgi:hypothetical protein
MALANVVVTVNEPNVTVSSDNVNVTVAQTTTNVTVGNATIVSNADVRAAISVTDTGGFGNLSYAEGNGVFTFAGTSSSDIRTSVSVTDAGGDGSLAYDNGTGVVTYTGPSAAEVRAHFSNTSPITYNASTGVIGLEQSLDDITLKKYQETIVDSGTVSGVVALDIADGTVRKMEIGADITGFTFSNLSAGGSVTLIITQDGGGSNSLDTTTTPGNWTAWEFAGELASLDENGGNWTIITIFYNGSKYFASVVTQAATLIQNSELANSSLIVNGTSISLGGSGNIANLGALTTTDLTEGTNLYFTDARADARVNLQTGTNLDLSSKSTSELTEGTNLYYTSARANADSVAHIATVPLTVGGNLNVSGNLEVTGNINYREVTDLLVQDQTITMNYGNATAQDAQIIVDRTGTGGGPNTDIKWNEATNVWTFTNDGTTYYNLHTPADSLTATNITATGGIDATGAITGVTTNVQANQFYGNTLWASYLGSNADAIGIGASATGDYDNPQIPNGTKVVISGGTGNISSVAGTYYLRKATHPSLTSGSYYELFTDAALTTPSQLGGLTTDATNTGATVNIPAVQTTTDGKWYTLGGFDTIGDINLRGNITSTSTGFISINGDITTSSGNIDGANLNATSEIHATGDIFTGGFFEGDLNGAVTIDVYNNTAGTFSKGEAVYLTGGNNGDNPHVDLADSDDVTKMPALGIVRENISAGATGQVVTSGVMNNSSHGYTAGADLYIDSVAGGLTTTIPTGENKQIQKIGKVVSNNHILVQGAFRQNATPNLNDGNIFIGSSTNVATTRSLDTLGQVLITSNTFGAKEISQAQTNMFGSAGAYGADYLQFDQYTTPQFPAGSRVELTGGVAGNPFSDGSITPDNVFYVASAGGGAFRLYTDPALSNATVSGSPDLTVSEAPLVNYSAFSVSPSGVTFANVLQSDTVTIGDAFSDDSVFTLHGEATINTANNSQSALTLAQRSANSVEGPLLTLYKDNTNPASAGDTQGHILFKGDNATGASVDFARIESVVATPDSGNEDGKINVKLMKAGTETTALDITSSYINASNGAGIKTTDTYTDGPTYWTSNETTTGAFGAPVNADALWFVTNDGTHPRTRPTWPTGSKITITGGSGNEVALSNGSITADNTFYVVSDTPFANYDLYYLYTDSALSNAVQTGGGASNLTYPSTLDLAYNTLDVNNTSYEIEVNGPIISTQNVTTTGNISGSYIKGDGSELTNLPTGGNSFGTALVAGQTNIQASQSNATIEFVAGTDISLTTSGNAVTITSTASGGGGTYGNANVQLWLDDGNNAGNITTAGNLNVNGSTANVDLAATNFFGSAANAPDTVDQVQFASAPGWANDTAITFKGTTNSNLTFLNGNTYYVQSRDATTFALYTTTGTGNPSQSGLFGEAVSGLTAEYVGLAEISATIGGTFTNTGTVSLASSGGNTDVGGHLVMQSGKTLYTSQISVIGGGTLTLSSVRVTDFKANDPIGMQEYANSAIGSVVPFKGSIAYVNGDRHGSRGAPCYYDGSDWRYFSDDATANV